MKFIEIIKLIFPYLHSVRKIKSYISFDLIFPEKWVFTESLLKDLQYTQNDVDDKIIVSFVCEPNEENLTNTIDDIKRIIKYNLDKETKEKLFNDKVKELKKIFEKSSLDDLMTLKMDIEKELNLETITEDASEERN